MAQTSGLQMYDVLLTRPGGRSRVHQYSIEGLRPGVVLRMSGRYWLVVQIALDDANPIQAVAVPARYRIRARYPDGREELGAFRRFRTGGPHIGHAFTTVEDGRPVSWHVVDERLVADAQGDPYLELLAERDYSEAEELPDHELEHLLPPLDERLPPEAYARLLEATAEGLSFELAALDPGEEPAWDEAERYIDSLVLDEVEDDLLELCGVDPDRDPPETWLSTVRSCLRSDLDRFRADIEGDHVQIEEWDYLDGRIFASVGTWEDEAKADSGHGWMCRLLDSDALGAAGFARVRKTEL